MRIVGQDYDSVFYLLRRWMILTLIEWFGRLDGNVFCFYLPYAETVEVAFLERIEFFAFQDVKFHTIKMFFIVFITAPYKYYENITHNMKENEEIVFEIASNEETACERLYESVNAYIDRVIWGLKGILHQVLTPNHRLTYEEMQALVRVMEYHFVSHPVHYAQKTLVEAIIIAKKQCWNIPDTLLSKIAGLNEDEVLEVTYRIYAFVKMKEIITAELEQL